LLIEDSADSNNKKKIQISSINKIIASICMFSANAIVVQGDGVDGYRISESMDGWYLSNCGVSCDTIGSSTGTTDIQLRVRRASDGSQVDMLSTKMTLETQRSCNDGVIKSDGSETVYAGDIVYVDVDAVQSNAPLGLMVTMEFKG